jgi:hypothetical protein
MARLRLLGEDFDDIPPVRKAKREKDPHEGFEERCRLAILRSPEEWLTSKYVSQTIRSGHAHVLKVMEKMVGEGILCPSQPVPMAERDVSVFVGRKDEGYAISAFPHGGKWVIGYFAKSASDARKTVVVHGRPKLDDLGRSRARGMPRRTRTPTAKMKDDYEKSFKYKLADWDGMAYRLARGGKPFINACLAARIEPMTDLPWTCSCERVNPAEYSHCRRNGCHKEKPKLLVEPVKLCPDCGQSDEDNHSKRHGARSLKKARQNCMQRIVEQVHGR